MRDLTQALLAAEMDPVNGALAPEWVHLIPNGSIAARDGRRFRLSDPERVVEAFRTNGIDLPIDYEHQTDKATPGGPVPAAGWITEIEARADGIWGRVRWTEKANALLAAQEYRYLSPVIVHEKSGEIVRLKGAGLVHRPALRLTALASEDDRAMGIADLLDALAEIFNLSPDMPVEDMLTAIRRVSRTPAEPDPAHYVPREAVAELLRDRNATKDALSERDVRRKVEDALHRGYITPAMTDWATTLCAQDEASFEEFLVSAAPAYAHLFAPSRVAALPPGGSTLAAASDKGAIQSLCDQLGLSADRFAD